MEWAGTTLAFYGLGAAALATSLVTLRRRLELSKVKHRTPNRPARMARRVAALVPFYDYDESRFFCPGDAPEEIVARRRAGFKRLAALYDTRFAETIRLTAEVTDGISDLQFTDVYRVPFQYGGGVRRHLKSPAFVQSSAGVMLADLDGNRFYDLTGSYGVNVLGYDFYKRAIARAVERVGELGPVLGPYHPVVADNVQRLKELSGLDEVSFHMSGTEAVMQAVRLPAPPPPPPPPLPSGAILRRLPRLVGRRATGHRQPAAGARDLHAQGHVGGFAARPAHATRHRLCAHQSAAGAASERVRAERLVAGRWRAARAFRQGGLCRLAQAPAGGLHRAKHRLDLR